MNPQGSPQRRAQAQPQNAAAQQHRRESINKDSAVDTLQSMFSNVERDVIQMILLEGCGGNMEAAVEALLVMSGAPPSAPQQQRQPAPPHNAPPSDIAAQYQQRGHKRNATQPQSSYHHRPAAQQQQQQQPPRQHRRQASEAPEMKQQVSINLPDDFLRPPSYYLSKYPKADDDTPPVDPKVEKVRQEAEDKLYATKLFEDSLFMQDLRANPEWLAEAIEESQDPSKARRTRAATTSAPAAKDKESSFKNGRWGRSKTNTFSVFNRNRSSSAAQSASVPPKANSQSPEIDPSDIDARKISFKQRVNQLSTDAKSKLTSLATKLQKNKEDKKVKQNTAESHRYTSVMTSLDDEPLLDDDIGDIESPKESNRGTYVPPKPSQDL